MERHEVAWAFGAVVPSFLAAVVVAFHCFAIVEMAIRQVDFVADSAVPPFAGVHREHTLRDLYSQKRAW